MSQPVATCPTAAEGNLKPSDFGKANFSIEGYSVDGTVFDLEKAGRLMYLDAAAGEVSIRKMTVKNGFCAALSDDRNGAGFHLVQSTARLRDIHMSQMDCSFEETLPREFNGGALYFKDSTAHVQNVHVTDSVANHGAGVGSWGTDASIVEDSSFERLEGLRWGGAMLVEEHAHTEFHRCWFSHSYSPYGGILDDGGQASPLYRDCVFDHGTALHGSAYYGYGSLFALGHWCSPPCNGYSHAAVYLTATVNPTFENITVLNNTANVDVGGVRSFVPLGILFKNSRFIGNRMASNGADAAIQVRAGQWDLLNEQRLDMST
ncbi:CACNA1H [Symbiodinium pilosum]|uniref:CACNA1H protein n=1 Tax=Symbiodinium pilosum TaxID=2952 RepID=A0A812WFV6_SYMPI|nr:CACNA1H [Symbiodinium pilosum]